MIIKEYCFTRDFRKSAKKFSPKIQKLVSNRIDIFVVNPFSPKLHTHKLTGKLMNYYSFSVAYNLRIMFRFISKNTVEFIKIGSHEIYK